MGGFGIKSVAKYDNSPNYKPFENVPDTGYYSDKGLLIYTETTQDIHSKVDLTKWTLGLVLLAFASVFLVGIALVSFNVVQIEWNVGQVNHLEMEADWEYFKVKYGKFYTSPREEARQRAIYLKNKANVEAHNAKYEQGLVSYSLRVNEYSDIDPADFHRTRHGLVYTPAQHANASVTPQNYNLPSTFDWRDQGKVSSVKNQGQCGSCWSFSALGATESAMMMAGMQEVDLSEEELVDCFGRSCNGNNQPAAWDWLKQNGGAESADSYPYTAGQTGHAGQCRRGEGQVVIQVTGYKELNMPTDENTLKDYLKKNGPLAVDVDASNWSQQHDKGVFSCNPRGVDHAVLLVGWGDGYWIVKNSWGTDWGEEGYIRLAIGGNTDCGISRYYAAYPTIQ